MIHNMLTLVELDKMEPSQIFAYGFVDAPILGYNAKEAVEKAGKDVDLDKLFTRVVYCWIAVRGQIHDWAIYTSPILAEENKFPDFEGAGKSDRDIILQDIARNGTKVHDKTWIKRLVICTDEALNMYRD